ncbi:MAG: xanthine dehydrogenase family protein subunit M [Ardenticatenaceae bacterium]|nr:xanthine dehydrogenase family protein subunit M [Ardenticatenaceae bacterium]
MSDYMPRFQYVDAKSVEHAISVLDKYPGGIGVKRTAAVVAGGTDMLGELKDEIMAPKVVVNLRSISGLNEMKEVDGGVSIGALTTLWDIHESGLIQESFPVLAQAAHNVATPQIRQIGTLGGNINQRPRCWYYRGAFDCYKKGGDFCFSVTGDNQYHAIFQGELCYIVHPSDTAPALMALDASAKVASPSGEKTVSLDEYFVGPRVDVLRETILGPNEIMTGVQIPTWPAGTKSIFLKYRERGAWDFAIASLAMVVSLQDGVVSKAGIVFSGVAPVPYRAKEAEKAIVGKPLNDETAQSVANTVSLGARPMSKNGYKVDLIKGMMRQAVLKLA